MLTDHCGDCTLTVGREREGWTSSPEDLLVPMLYTSCSSSKTPPDRKTLIQLRLLIHSLGLIQACWGSWSVGRRFQRLDRLRGVSANKLPNAGAVDPKSRVTSYRGSKDRGPSYSTLELPRHLR